MVRAAAAQVHRQGEQAAACVRIGGIVGHGLGRELQRRALQGATAEHVAIAFGDRMGDLEQRRLGVAHQEPVERRPLVGEVIGPCRQVVAADGDDRLGVQATDALGHGHGGAVLQARPAADDNDGRRPCEQQLLGLCQVGLLPAGRRVAAELHLQVEHAGSQVVPAQVGEHADQLRFDPRAVGPGLAKQRTGEEQEHVQWTHRRLISREQRPVRTLPGLCSAAQGDKRHS